jgi:hypothetical protein
VKGGKRHSLATTADGQVFGWYERGGRREEGGGRSEQEDEG